MKKILILLGFLLLFTPDFAYAFRVKLIVHSVECVENEKLVIRFSLENERNISFANTSLCFKLTSNDEPVACKELRVTAPAKADGTEIYETVIETPCGGEGYSLKSTVYLGSRRYKIEEWFEGCPGTWKSPGGDKLEPKTGD